MFSDTEIADRITTGDVVVDLQSVATLRR